jgi:hypothetical protein
VFHISFLSKLDGWLQGQHLAGTTWKYGVSVTTPREFFESFVPRSLGTVTGMLPGDVVVAFHIEGPEGGSWQVERDDDGSRVGPTIDGPKDCELWCTADTFMRMVRGSLGSSRAFLSGKLRIAGDVGLAMALEGFLKEAA